MHIEPKLWWLDTSNNTPHSDGVTVTVEWGSSDNDNTNFYVTITPPAVNSDSPSTVITTNQTSHIFTIPYNNDYTISVIGSNCAGNSSEIMKTFSFGKHHLNHIIITIKHLLQSD